jgi:hypothetical protein
MTFFTKERKEIMHTIKKILLCLFLFGFVFSVKAQCTKDVDCKGDRVCINGQCVEQNAEAENAPSQEPKDKFDGVHMGLGVSVGGGFTIVSVNPNPATVDGEFMAAVRFSALFRRFELQAEFSPYSYIPSTSGPAGFSLTTTAGVYLPMGSVACWPLRAGIGWANINERDFFQARADLIGVALRFKNCLVEVSLPTYRFITDFDIRYGYMISFNAGFAWIF